MYKEILCFVKRCLSFFCLLELNIWRGKFCGGLNINATRLVWLPIIIEHSKKTFKELSSCWRSKLQECFDFTLLGVDTFGTNSVSKVVNWCLKELEFLDFNFKTVVLQGVKDLFSLIEIVSCCAIGMNKNVSKAQLNKWKIWEESSHFVLEIDNGGHDALEKMFVFAGTKS